MTAARPRPTLVAVTMPTAAPTLASLQQARARQGATTLVFRRFGLAVVLLVVIDGAIRGLPHGVHDGRSLGVLLALVGFVVGTLGAMRGPYWSPRQGLPFILFLVGSSAALIWLQPDGPGVLGSFVGVSVAGMRLPGRGGLLVGTAALVVVTVAVSAGSGRSLNGLLLNDTGLIAFFTVSRLATRLREGQDQAIALLAELEASHRAEAEAVALAERQRVARDMHDVLAHSLSGLVLQLEGARLLAERDGGDPELSAAVDRALHLGKAGLTEARRAIGTLRDDELPGPERLPALVQEFERDTGIRCSIDVAGEERPLGSAARLTLYRVAQEALTNVRRHAQRPESVALHLAYEADGTRLVVEDVAAVAAEIGNNDDAGGYGITGMRERAELLGGRLDAAPTERGFRVELWVPA
jgi:signal transduction histidine kinase